MKKMITVVLLVSSCLMAESKCGKHINQGAKQYKKVQTSLKFGETPNLIDVGMTKHYMLNAYSECEGLVSDEKLNAIADLIKNMQAMEKEITKIKRLKMGVE